MTTKRRLPTLPREGMGRVEPSDVREIIYQLFLARTSMTPVNDPHTFCLQEPKSETLGREWERMAVIFRFHPDAKRKDPDMQ